MEDKLTRIGIFYDGNYFYNVSNYYYFNHSRRARISIEGLHRFIRWQVAESEGTDERYCQVVDAHYFRGRLSASEAQDRQLLYGERVFDDVLMRAGVTTHYLPLSGLGGKRIDVWFALEAFELAMHKRYTVSVLVTGDGDYVPLVRKLNTLGTRVMLLGWDFAYIGQDGKERTTRTSQELIEEVTYPIQMSGIIDDRAHRNDLIINNLFFIPRQEQISARTEVDTKTSVPEPEQGRVRWFDTEKGYVFLLRPNGDDLFLHHSAFDGDASVLKQDDEVEYVIGLRDDDGRPIARNVRLLKENRTG